MEQTNQDKGYRDLSEHQRRFVDAYLKCANSAQAAQAAGYARDYGSKLLAHPAVIAAIFAAQEKLRAATEYDVKAAMREAEEAMDFARSTDNANAYVKAVELRSKLMGLLVDKLDVRQLTNFRINILGMSTPAALPEPIDVGPQDPAAVPPPVLPEPVPFAAHVPLPLNPVRESLSTGYEAPIGAPTPAADASEDIFGL